LGEISRDFSMSDFAEIRVRPSPAGLSEPLLIAYVAIVSTLAVLLGAVLATGPHRGGEMWATLALSAVAALSERGRVRLSRTTESSIALVPVIFAAVTLGAFAALIVGAASLLGDFRPPYMKLVVYTCTRAITGALAGLAAAATAPLFPDRFAGIAVATIVAALVAETADTAFAATTHWLRGNGTFSNAIRVIGPLVLAAVPMYVPVIAILAAAYKEVSAWTLPLFFVPAVAAQRLFALYREQTELADELRSANARLERAGLSFAGALVATLDARDRYTAGHSAAVAVYARDIATRLGLPEDERQLAHLCGLVHDIGKIGLPPGLLEKPGPLTLDERRQMEEHAAVGERILSKVENYADIARVVRHHHERVDGNGYPDNLVGDEIPLISRILSVADAYDAMTSDRPYRDAMPSRVARLRLAQAVETQFDTSVVAAFEAILASSDEAYREGSVGLGFARLSGDAEDRITAPQQWVAV
jgi:putative nucleotidyltransferase with HDIG domain